MTSKTHQHADFFHLDGAAYETARDAWNRQRLAGFQDAPEPRYYFMTARSEMERVTKALLKLGVADSGYDAMWDGTVIHWACLNEAQHARMTQLFGPMEPECTVELIQ